MKTAYGSKELIRCLIHLKYAPEPQVGSRHRKYRSPNHVEKGTMPFVLVIQGKSEYDPYWQREYIKQIKRHGFSEAEIEMAMWR